MRDRTKLDAVIEIDHGRGVLYVHDLKLGYTMLRISGLPTPVKTPAFGDGLDIGVSADGPAVCNWREKKKG
jgi:hypothetical protein